MTEGEAISPPVPKLMNMEKLIELIHKHDYDWSMIDEQRRWDEGFAIEKQIRDMLRQYLWEDIEPHIQEDWRKEAVKRLF
jgi:hypothetical protein